MNRFAQYRCHITLNHHAPLTPVFTIENAAVSIFTVTLFSATFVLRLASHVLRATCYFVLHDVMAQTAPLLWSRYGATLWHRLCFREWRKLLRRSSRLKRHFYTCSLLQECAGNVRMRSGGVRLVEGAVVLGVETSCDDTGVGVVDVSGRVRGEALHSQLKEHQK